MLAIARVVVHPLSIGFAIIMHGTPNGRRVQWWKSIIIMIITIAVKSLFFTSDVIGFLSYPSISVSEGKIEWSRRLQDPHTHRGEKRWLL